MFGKKKKRLEISAPSNFEHRVHTGFDPREQKFTGLPQQWQSLLSDTANRPKPMVDPSYITPIQLAPMKVRVRADGGLGQRQTESQSFSALLRPRLLPSPSHLPHRKNSPHLISAPSFSPAFPQPFTLSCVSMCKCLLAPYASFQSAVV